MKYRCRMTMPKPVGEGNWIEIEADSPERAVQEYHVRLCDFDAGKHWWVSTGEDIGYRMFFARIEIEGWGDTISRVYHYGLWRKGGVGPRVKPTLQAVADAVGWKGDPEELVEEGWNLEESMEEAEARRYDGQ